MPKKQFTTWQQQAPPEQTALPQHDTIKITQIHPPHPLPWKFWALENTVLENIRVYGERNIHCQQLTWEEGFTKDSSWWDSDLQQNGYPSALCRAGYFQCPVTECWRRELTEENTAWTSLPKRGFRGLNTPLPNLPNIFAVYPNHGDLQCFMSRAKALLCLTGAEPRGWLLNPPSRTPGFPHFKGTTPRPDRKSVV